MCDDSAVRWSNYESHTSQIESEVRNKILQGLSFFIQQSKEKQLGNQFVMGLETAYSFVRGEIPAPPPPAQDDSQQTFF